MLEYAHAYIKHLQFFLNNLASKLLLHTCSWLAGIRKLILINVAFQLSCFVVMLF